MFKLAKKWWKYATAKLTGKFNDNADPKVQLEQAIAEAQAQHKRLREQAVSVIAGQKQSEIRLNGKMAELEKLNGNARQALIMAADAEKAGNADKAAQYEQSATGGHDRRLLSRHRHACEGPPFPSGGRVEVVSGGAALRSRGGAGGACRTGAR